MIFVKNIYQAFDKQFEDFNGYFIIYLIKE